MKRLQLLLSVLMIALFIGSCTVAKEPNGVWVNTEKRQGKTFNKAFIVVVTGNLEARALLETDIANIVIKKGYHAVKSIDVLPPDLKSNSTIPTKDEIIKKVKESGCDAVFVASVLKKEADVNYTAGTEAYTTLPYATMPYSGWGGTYFGYYSYAQSTVSTPGYYSKEKSYFIQSNLYDAASGDIMWSVQSKVLDPQSLTQFSKDYTSKLIGQLKQEKLFVKK